MAYKQLKDGTIIVSGFKNGIAESPYDGISDMRNVNIISIPNEVSVNFKTSKISAPPTAGSLTTTASVGDTVTLTGGNLEPGQAIFFTGLSNTGAGLANNTPYWVKTGSTSPYTLSAVYPGTGAVVDITANSITGFWQTYNMATPTYFTKDSVNVTPGNYWTVDSSGQCWSNIATTTGNSYWIYMGNYGGGVANNALGMNGNGIVYYQGSDGLGWIFVFRNSAIDYTPALANSIGWVYGWKPSDASTGNAPGYLKTSGGTNNPHEALLAPDNKIYYCDSNWIGRWYQTDPTNAFVPTTLSTYINDTTSLLPFTDTALCLAPLGSNILVGGTKNTIYPWDTFSSLPLYPILIAENYISKMITINTNTFFLAGNRGRIYRTDGTQAQLFKKIPDHLSGTVEPYFKWGGIGSTKNQLYFGAVGTTNAGTNLNQYGGLWSIDVDTKAIRLTNQSSYGTYAGYVSALIPIINPPGTNNPGGTGIYMGWDTQETTRGVSNGVLNSTTTVTSATIAFTANDVGSTISGTGIPVGTTIASVTNATTAVMSQQATASASGVTLIISSGFGIDQTTSQPYSGGQAYIDSDLVPIGTVLIPKTNGTVEFKLSVPIVSGESVKLQYRQKFSDSFTDCGTTLFTYATSTNGSGTGWNGYAGTYQNVNFQNSQWIQVRAVLTSTNTTPSYCRLTELRLK